MPSLHQLGGRGGGESCEEVMWQKYTILVKENKEEKKNEMEKKSESENGEGGKVRKSIIIIKNEIGNKWTEHKGEAAKKDEEAENHAVTSLPRASTVSVVPFTVAVSPSCKGWAEEHIHVHIHLTHHDNDVLCSFYTNNCHIPWTGHFGNTIHEINPAQWKFQNFYA